jgi:hypothetical protein
LAKVFSLQFRFKMFQNEIRVGSSPWAFAAQQVGVPLGFVMWGLYSGELPRLISNLGRPLGAILEAIVIVTVAGLPAFFLGRLVGRNSSDFSDTGKWIWILPSMLVLMIIGLTGFRVRDTEDFLFPVYDGDAWWAVVMRTYPAIGCIAYSLGIALRRRQLENQELKQTV